MLFKPKPGCSFEIRSETSQRLWKPGLYEAVSQTITTSARCNERGAFLLVAWVATKGVVLLLPGASQLTAVLPTEHFSHNEDEYCSAKATAQEQIQQRIACCGQKD
jgi:hypothetical protein